MSCLFNSLSRFVDDNSGEIRRKICDYLETNPILFSEVKAEDIILWESNTTLFNYVSKMRHISTWGGAIEIRAFCNLYNLSVEVVNIRDSKGEKSIFFPCNIKNVVESNEIEENIINEESRAKISWNGGHYEPL
jgi:hypothetical protein